MYGWRLLATTLTVTTALVISATALPAQGAVRCAGVAVTILGTAGNDVIRGTARADVIHGLDGSDRIYGLGGDDIVCGGEGVDRLLGGGGDDRLHGGLDHVPDQTHKRGDTLEGGPGDDLLDPGLDRRTVPGGGVPDKISWRSSSRPITLDMRTGVARGLGRDRIVGTAYSVDLSNRADRVTGSARDDVISTFGGADHVSGGRGDDVIFADDPNRATPAPGPSRDVVRGGGGRDWIITREGVDRLFGGSGSDTIEDRGPTADRIVGGPGRDGIEDTVGGGRQEFLLGDARDTLEITNYTGGRAPGTLDLRARTTRVQGRRGAGFIKGFRSLAFGTRFGQGGVVHHGRPWTVRGTAAAEDVAVSISAAVRFVGREGNDRFLDGQRDDTFDGGPGSDTMVGDGGGSDTCIAVEGGLQYCEVVRP